MCGCTQKERCQERKDWLQWEHIYRTTIELFLSTLRIITVLYLQYPVREMIPIIGNYPSLIDFFLLQKTHYILLLQFHHDTNVPTVRLPFYAFTAASQLLLYAIICFGDLQRRGFVIGRVVDKSTAFHISGIIKANIGINISMAAPKRFITRRTIYRHGYI